MLPRELARKIRYIQIYAGKAVNDVLAGEYSSVFKGRGMEFDEVREYTPGDDIRSIDWNVTARTGEPHVKRFVEERELTILLVVDLSASGSFGTCDRTKNEVAAELCALLAFSAIKNNDKVGLVVFTDQIELFIAPRKGASHVLRLIRDLLSFEPRQTHTDLNLALEYVGRIQRRRAVIFVISDFQCTGYERSMRILSRRHDVIALSVSDPRELDLPDVGLVELEDAETGERLLIDSNAAAVRSAYTAVGRRRRQQLAEELRRMKVDHAPIVTGQDYVRNLVGFFRTREKRLQR